MSINKDKSKKAKGKSEIKELSQRDTEKHRATQRKFKERSL
jgi:hypothetical protein